MTTQAPGEKLADGRPHLGGIESLRGYAASAIVIFHVIHLTASDPPQSLIFMKWFFGFGVPLFFVVSAFSLAYGYAGRLVTQPQIARFYLRRVFRIAPLFYTITLLSLAAGVGLGWIGGNLPQLAANLAFVFNLVPRFVDGIAPASWSIGVEMLFYLVLPAILLAVRGPVSAAVGTALAVVAAILFVARMRAMGDQYASFIPHGFLLNLPYFGFGLLSFFLLDRTPARLAPALIMGGGLGLLVQWWIAQVGLPQDAVGNTLYQAAWGVPFGMVCLGMALDPPLLLSNPVTRFLGRISFSLYLLHPHVVDAMRRVGVYDRIHDLPYGSGLTFPAAVLVTFAVVTPLAWLTYRFIEEPGMAWGRTLSQRLRAPTAAEPAPSQA